MTAVEEAVGAYRGLAETNTAAHGPDLAMSLNTLSISLGKAGRHDKGLAAIEEAAVIRADREDH